MNPHFRSELDSKQRALAALCRSTALPRSISLVLRPRRNGVLPGVIWISSLSFGNQPPGPGLGGWDAPDGDGNEPMDGVGVRSTSSFEPQAAGGRVWSGRGVGTTPRRLVPADRYHYASDFTCG